MMNTAGLHGEDFIIGREPSDGHKGAYQGPEGEREGDNGGKGVYDKSNDIPEGNIL